MAAAARRRRGQRAGLERRKALRRSYERLPSKCVSWWSRAVGVVAFAMSESVFFVTGLVGSFVFFVGHFVGHFVEFDRLCIFDMLVSVSLSLSLSLSLPFPRSVGSWPALSVVASLMFRVPFLARPLCLLCLLCLGSRRKE